MGLDNLPGSVTATEVQDMQKEIWELRQKVADRDRLIGDQVEVIAERNLKISDLQNELRDFHELSNQQ